MRPVKNWVAYKKNVNSEGILLGPDTFDEFFVCRIMTLYCDDVLGQSTFGKNCWATTLSLTRPKCPSAHHAGNLWPVPNLPNFRAQISGWKLENRVAYKKCVTLSFRMSLRGGDTHVPRVGTLWCEVPRVGIIMIWRPHPWEKYLREVDTLGHENLREGLTLSRGGDGWRKIWSPHKEQLVYDMSSLKSQFLA